MAGVSGRDDDLGIMLAAIDELAPGSEDLEVSPLEEAGDRAELEAELLSRYGDGVDEEEAFALFSACGAQGTGGSNCAEK